MDDKPYAPSNRKLKKAYERGEKPSSSLLTAAVSTALTLLILGIVGKSLWAGLLALMEACFLGQKPPLMEWIGTLIALLLTSLLATLMMGLWQTGAQLSWQHLKPKWRAKKGGIKGGELGIALLKFLALSLPLTLFLWIRRSFSYPSLYLLLLGTALLFVFIGIIDLFYRRWLFLQQQRMTYAEKKEEQRETRVKRKRR